MKTKVESKGESKLGIILLTAEAGYKYKDLISCYSIFVSQMLVILFK